MRTVIRFCLHNLEALINLRKLQRLADIKENEIGFFSTGRIGDNLYVLLLSKSIKEHYKPSRLKLIVPHKIAKLATLWPVDAVLPVDDSVLEKICFSDVGHIYGLKHASLNRLNCAHPGSLEKISGIDNLNFFQLVKYQIGLSKDAKIEPPSDLPASIYRNIESTYPYNVLKNSMFVSLESRAVRISNEMKCSLLDKIIEYTTELKCNILFNEESWYELANRKFPKESERFFKINSRDLLETLGVLRIVGKAFSVRSGLSDLVVISGAKTIIYYPRSVSDAYGINIPYRYHFSVEELKLLNPYISEIEECDELLRESIYRMF